MKQKLLSLIFVLTCLIGVSFAQDRQVGGKVTSTKDGAAISGVSVSVVGSTKSTQTDANGNYSLTVPVNSTLSFSSVGYIAFRASISDKLILDVVLQPEEAALDEVVVVGYATTTKESFTGSAKKVSSEDLTKKNTSNITQALSGEVAGLQVVNASGQPGTAATVRIRGFGSVNGNRDPLYVVDGVPFSGNLTSINNADIESATVLKDAAATAIYGSRGANGVIIITTKSGRGKQSFVDADVNVGFNAALLPRYDVIKSPEEFIGLAWESMYNQGVSAGQADPAAFANRNLFANSGLRPANNLWNVTNVADLIDPVTRTVRPGVTRKFDPESWEDYAFQSSGRQDINVRFGGSSDKTNYYTSLGYLNDKGYSINSDFKRYSGRLNLDHQVKPWMKVGMNLGATRTTRNVGGQSSDSGSIFWFVDNIPSIYPLFERDANGNKINDPYFGGYVFDYGIKSNRRFGSLTNAIGDATYDVKRHNRNELNGRAYVNFTIIDGLTFENSLGIQYYNNVYIDRGNRYYGSSAETNGSLYHQRTERKTSNLLNLLRYRKTVDQHSIEVLAAHESSSFSDNILNVSGSQLVDDYSLEFNNVVISNPTESYNQEYTLESFFGQVNYDFNKKYYLTGSLRRDGSSRFYSKKWGTFGSVGAGWVISNENFFKNQNVLNFLKLKASYGVIGDQAGVGFYPGFVTYSIENVDNKPAFSFDIKGNPDLTWETSKMFQTGVEFEVGKFLTGSFEYYIKNTSNLIFDRQMGPSIGYKYVKVNDGNLRNQGFEFDLTGHVLKTANAYFDISLNGEMFKNKITKMPTDPGTGQPKNVDIQGAYGWSQGRSIYDMYMRDFVGVDPADGKSMWKVYYLDKNGDGQFSTNEQINSLNDYENPEGFEVKEGTTKKYNEATQYYIGKSAIPKIRGAFSLRGGYKNFDLAVQFLYSLGGYAYDGVYAGLMGSGTVGGNNWHRDILNRWQKDGDVTDVPRLSNNTDPNVTSLSSRYVTKANYLALNNVRLGYRFSNNMVKSIGFEGLSIWASADNLWIHTARKGFNPSTSESGASSTYRYSPLSTFSFGLNAKF